MSENFYTRLRGLVEGPFTAEELQNRARRRRFGRHYQVSTDNRTWSPASSFPELFPPPPERRRRRQVAEPDARPGSDQESLEAVDLVEGPLPGDAGDEGVLDAIPLQSTPEAGQPSWWYVGEDRECGPVSFAELRSFAAAGQIVPETLVWTEGWEQWGPAQQVPDLFRRRSPEPAVVRESRREDRGRADRSAEDEDQPSDETPATAPMAVASLVLGISVIGCILAVVFGHVALGQIHHSQKTRRPLGGRGMALAGLIIGYVVIGLLVVGAIGFTIWKLIQPE